MKYIISIITIFCLTCFQPIKIKQPIPYQNIVDISLKVNSRDHRKNEAPQYHKEETVTSSHSSQQAFFPDKSRSHKEKDKDLPKVLETSPFSSSQLSMLRVHLVSLINKERKSPVSLYGPLISSSSLRAKEAYQKWSHTRPNQTRWNTTLHGIININNILHGENLAKTQITSQQNYSDQDIYSLCQTLHNALVNSSTHYKVMTNSNYKKVNIGFYTETNDNTVTVVIAQHYIQ